MKFVDEYRDATAARRISELIRAKTTKPWKIMEICGGQTHSIVRFGIGELLPQEITLVHGPGCPVCVTPIEVIDRALAIASLNNVIFCTFADMLRVPGTSGDLFSIKGRGGDIRFMYSPLEALAIAKANPDKEVVFFAVGFETTAPATAMTAFQAKTENLSNFSLLVSHVLVPPAIEAILCPKNSGIQGFLAAGHVCTVMGYAEYEPLAKKYGVPIVVTGFEPIDILSGIYLCVKQLEEGRAEVENQYSRSVKREGAREAQALVNQVFEPTMRKWRGIGGIDRSGLKFRPDYEKLDAEIRFNVSLIEREEDSLCISGSILQGFKKPFECPAFGTSCTPEHPLGATMVSSEGACSAYYKYRRDDRETAFAEA
ncbi:MAG: hydrogenase formation protein HypD [Deltaproteobacteria bacterium]|nr:hydrogenase formation protein HypD [Deltaproteobacteria bacterium]